MVPRARRGSAGPTSSYWQVVVTGDLQPAGSVSVIVRWPLPPCPPWENVARRFTIVSVCETPSTSIVTVSPLWLVSVKLTRAVSVPRRQLAWRLVMSAHGMPLPSHSSGMPFPFASALVPLAMSHSSGTPFPLQSSLNPLAMSWSSGMPFPLQSGALGTSVFTVSCPVFSGSSQLERRVEFVPPPVHERENFPNQSEVWLVHDANPPCSCPIT